MANTVFYTQADGRVFGAIGARANFYSALNRGQVYKYKLNPTDETEDPELEADNGPRVKVRGETDAIRHINAFDWLYKKMAYATSTCGGSGLGTLSGGGLGEEGKSSLYSSSPRNRNGERNEKTLRYMPDPHITSVKLSAVGDFGSIRKCEVAFTCYTKGQLSSLSGFLELGATMKTSYGWNDAGGAGGPSGYFEGKVYNFSYSLNGDGGYDGISYAMGEGINSLTPNANAPTNATTVVADPSGVTITSNNVLNTVVADAKENDTLDGAVNAAVGIGGVKFSEDWATAKDATVGETPPPAAPTPAKEAAIHHYVSLERIVQLINLMLKANSSNISQIICNDTVTIGFKPNVAEFVSADPSKVIFPGYGTYGINVFSFGDYDGPFQEGKLGKTMISVTYLSTIFADMETQFNTTKKVSDRSIAKFLGTIFALILNCSGSLYRLSLVANPDDDKEFFVLDPNCIKDEGISILNLSAVSQGGVCRNVSLTSKVPSEMATVAFLSPTSTALSEHNSAAVAAISGGSGGGTVPAADLTTCITALDQGGCTPANVKSLQSALESARASTPLKGPSGEVDYTVMPVEFSATLDGIEGLIFGNAVTSNVVIDNANMVFTVTTVEHSISGNDWTTTVNTVCRTKP